jgi:predicted Rossmann fold nucleotide-binding protein DprA/Smf involved in DNA uptake
VRPRPSEDSLAILLVCSHLAIGKELHLKPFADSDWSALAERLVAAGLTPAQMLGMGAADLHLQLDLDSAISERVAALLSRGGQLALELERLSNLGIWAMTRADHDYPGRLKRRLRQRMPAVLFGIGPTELLSRPGVAIVGSRSLDDEGLRYATEAGRRVAEAGCTVFSGGSRGADAAAMKGALSGPGSVVGVLSEGVTHSLRDSSARDHVLEGSMALTSPFHPDVTFRAANAMARNKIVYCLAEAALIVSSSAKTGGTWAGATEALHRRWLPVYVRDGRKSPPGNHDLIKEGAQPVPFDPTSDRDSFASWISDLVDDAGKLAKSTSAPASDPLFDGALPILEASLQSPQSAAEVARSLQLEPAQAEAWLTKGVRLGLFRQVGGTFIAREHRPPAGQQERFTFE